MTLGDKPNISLKDKSRLYVKCQSCEKLHLVEKYTIRDARKNKNDSYTLGSAVFFRDEDGFYVHKRLCSRCEEYHDKYG